MLVYKGEVYTHVNKHIGGVSTISLLIRFCDRLDPPKGFLRGDDVIDMAYLHNPIENIRATYVKS